jgi:hypothetical protein
LTPRLCSLSLLARWSSLLFSLQPLILVESLGKSFTRMTAWHVLAHWQHIMNLLFSTRTLPTDQYPMDFTYFFQRPDLMFHLPNGNPAN